MHIGLLEDDADIIDIISIWLETAGNQVQAYTTGKSFREGMIAEKFDMLILDWHLPDTTGISELKWIRGEMGSSIPVIFNTSREDEQSIVEALDHGADDYLVKPVSREITLARINALQRRNSQGNGDSNKGLAVDGELEKREPVEVYEPYQVDYSLRKIFINDEEIMLTNKEFELAALMFKHAASLLSRDYLLATVWGMRPDINTRTVDTHISRIRSKLGLGATVGWQLTSIYQRGYRLSRQ